MNDKPELPSTEEVVEPIRKLLEFLDTRYDNWDNIPQVNALRALFHEHGGRAGRDLAFVLWGGVEERLYGPRPRFNRKPHEQRDEWMQIINTIAHLATQKVSEKAETTYRDARRALLADSEIFTRVPDSIKMSETLSALRTVVDQAARDAINIESSKKSFMVGEFRALTSWLDGSSLIGSPEWIAEETWYVKTQLDLLRNMLFGVTAIRDAVIGQGSSAERANRWKRFVDREFHGNPLIYALEVTWNALVVMMNIQGDPPVKPDGEANRRQSGKEQKRRSAR
jgi:hypothetical protein